MMNILTGYVFIRNHRQTNLKNTKRKPPPSELLHHLNGQSIPYDFSLKFTEETPVRVIVPLVNTFGGHFGGKLQEIILEGFSASNMTEKLYRALATEAKAYEATIKLKNCHFPQDVFNAFHSHGFEVWEVTLHRNIT